MTNSTEKMLTTSWNLVRDAGSAVADAAANSNVASTLMRTLPKAREMISVGAGLAVARRGTRIAVAAVRRHPVAAIAGAVALAGVGLAMAAAKRRKEAQANGESVSPRKQPRRVTAKNMRGNAQGSASASRASAEKTAPRRASKTSAGKPQEPSTH